MNVMIDSGAYSISVLSKKIGKKVDIFKDYRKYLDNYVYFIRVCQKQLGKEYKDNIIFVTLDVIRDVEQSRLVYRYMTEECGCDVMPVVHFGASPSALEWYLRTGCSYVGLGGLSHKVLPSTYMHHADTLFSLLVDRRGNPLVKVHGFAVTSLPLLLRYPWWSVDSTSLWKYAAFGYQLYVPRKCGKNFDFLRPLMIKFSERQMKAKLYVGRLNINERKILMEYLEMVNFAKKFYDEGLNANDVCILNAVYTLMLQNCIGNMGVCFKPKVSKVFVL